MTTHTHRRTGLSRLALAGAFILIGLGGTAQAATATPDAVDTGGSGAGGAPVSDAVLDGPSLVGSGPEREIVAATELDGPSLVGSGPEREIVASSDGQETAGTLSDADVAAIISASGGNGQSVVFGDSTLDETARSNDLIAMSGGTIASTDPLDETARSGDLIALSPTANLEVATVHRGQPY